MNRPRILLADDHRLLREAFAELLASTCDVVGTVADGRALLQAAPQLRPDVVVLDVAMPLLNGLDAAKEIIKISPRSKIILRTAHREEQYVQQALQAGIRGYVLKCEATTTLTSPMRRHAEGPICMLRPPK